MRNTAVDIDFDLRVRRYIRESNGIEGIYDKKEIDQSLIAWKYLNDLKVITHKDICKLQNIITEHQPELLSEWRGTYRSFSKLDVSVGTYKAPRYEQVNQLMHGWLKELPLMSPTLAHIRFESIHPFADGNGRVGRMIYWWHCLQFGRTPELWTAKERKFYYKLFEEWRINNLIKSNWGIDYRLKYEAIIKVQDKFDPEAEPKILIVEFEEKVNPKDKEQVEKLIKSALPRKYKLLEIIEIKEPLKS